MDVRSRPKPDSNISFLEVSGGKASEIPPFLPPVLKAAMAECASLLLGASLVPSRLFIYALVPLQPGKPSRFYG